MKALFSDRNASDIFATPKPVRFLQRVLEVATDKDSLVLDSFAGAGTADYAVPKQNAEDGGTRKFILIEMDDTIARDVTSKRVKRVTMGYIGTGDSPLLGIPTKGAPSTGSTTASLRTNRWRAAMC